ncbi:MAG TPA: BamA/TamA family outer membrane protein [Sphingobacteriaceae bacterium]
MIKRAISGIALAAIVSISPRVSAQNKLIDKFLSNKKDTTRSASFLPLPVIGYAQETGLEFGLLPLYSFYTDKSDTLTRTSSVSAIATYTTNQQSNFYLKSDIWTPQNKYHFTSEFRYKDFPFNFYGTGDRTLDVNKELVTQKQFKAGVEAEKRFGPGAYTGVTVNYENYRFYDRVAGGIYPNNISVFDPDGGQVLFIGLSQIIDSRNSNTYTTRGTLIKINYAYAPGFFGGDSFKGSQTRIDVRNFHSFNKKTVLGINGNYQSLAGTRVPFYLMRQLGNDAMMRGYYTGRYRDQNMLALQGELRYRFIPRLGVAAFAAAGTVYAPRSLDFDGIKPSAGAGLRYFFDIDRGLSVRVDYAVGEKRPGEKRQNGFYLSLGEAF